VLALAGRWVGGRRRRGAFHFGDLRSLMAPGSVFVGIDAGLTSTKAIVLDAAGRCLGSASRTAIRDEGRYGEVERDLWQQWDDCCRVVGEALGDAEVSADDVAGVGVTGHGDGLILVDESGSPVRPGILSLDTRAGAIVVALERDGRADSIALESGRPPASGRPVTLLLWIKEHEPASLRSARWILFTKDWIKLRLSGRATTDFSDASGGLLTRWRPAYAQSLLCSLGLREVIPKLPEIVPSLQAAGVVSAEAAAVTGLRPGTPIASGSHDLTASIIGAGATEVGTVVKSHRVVYECRGCDGLAST
jgi:L-xylulokinase